MNAPSDLSFGVAAPQIHAQFPVDPAQIQSYIQRAEALGFHSLWVQEQAGLRISAGALEGVSMLSYAAALTRKVRLGAAVFLVNLRSPVQLAKSLASLDQLSEGRLIAGVGLGAVTRLYEAYGLSPERRLARFIEAITLIQKLWTEDDLTFDGQFWKIAGASLLPKPVQKPHPPIWFGGHAPAALRRAVKRGSGFIGAGSKPTADFKTEARTVLEALAEGKKDPAEFTIGKRVYIGVDNDRERARRRIMEWSQAYYGNAELGPRVSVFGGADECAEQLKEVVAAGARFILFNPMFDVREQLEILAGEVIPRTRAL
ncbi:MAG: LLM class flavin-dependent oxidoreductase [Deltaproteobacteria bacterium]|nr:LLM class flavin-dependent oxidoreductase [Deltaproteobacteria bacterium]